MDMLNCLIVEDEPLAAEILSDYVAQIPYLQLVAICPDAIYAMEQLQNHSIDVLFLDIHLPKLKGLDFLRSLRHPPKVILTTAYHQYALESYELEVVDYLLKPIEFSRFVKAVEKLKEQQPIIAKAQDSYSLSAAARPFRFFNVNKKKQKVYLDEILYVESLKEYVRLVLKEGNLITKMQLGTLEEHLPSDKFLRIHRSYLVAVEQISAFSAYEIEVGAHQIPIGRSYKVSVQNVLNSL